MTKMTPKQRLLAAFKCQEVDYLPCSIYFNPNLKVPGYDLSNPVDHIRLQLDLGGDPLADLGMLTGKPGATQTRIWLQENAGEPHPVLYKEYQTPAGILRHGVKYTPDWHSGMEIPWHDHTASNCYEPLIKSPDDVAAFEYIYQPPTTADLKRLKPHLEETQRRSREFKLPIRCLIGQGLATLIFIMGAERAITFAVDFPRAFKRLAEIDHKVNLARIDLAAKAKVDLVKRFGGYEQTNFFNPQIFRECVMPLLRKEVRAAHDAGLLIYYRIVTGTKPLLADIASIGFDCIEGGEPHLGNTTLEDWNKAFAGKACSWTGVSTPVLLGGDNPDAVRKEVRHCADVFGRQGFILGVTNSIRNHFPWKNTLALIDEWKKVRALKQSDNI
ncbi:hypothetical protein JXJ21_00805 [candidate division KSB1 bacterium]|nr:hypothetical protein [candidate division KSB1 bacterium]